MDFDTDVLTPTSIVLRPRGRLNMVAAPALRSVVDEVVGEGHILVVVDLGSTVFMDSSGLGALIAGLKTARQAGGDLRIACPTEQVLTGARADEPQPGAAPARDGAERPRWLRTPASGCGWSPRPTRPACRTSTTWSPSSGAQRPCWTAGSASASRRPVAEVMANIVEHAAGGELVALCGELLVFDHAVEAHFRDTGRLPAVDVSSSSALPDDWAESGRGLTMARQLVDDVVHEVDGGGNHWAVRLRA